MTTTLKTTTRRLEEATGTTSTLVPTWAPTEEPCNCDETTLAPTWAPTDGPCAQAAPTWAPTNAPVVATWVPTEAPVVEQVPTWAPQQPCPCAVNDEPDCPCAQAIAPMPSVPIIEDIQGPTWAPCPCADNQGFLAVSGDCPCASPPAAAPAWPSAETQQPTWAPIQNHGIHDQVVKTRNPLGVLETCYCSGEPVDSNLFNRTTSECSPGKTEAFFNCLLDCMGYDPCSKPHVQGLMHWFTCVPDMELRYMIEVINQGNPCKFWAPKGEACPPLSPECEGHWCR